MNTLTTRTRWSLTDWLFILGYLCLVACYTPQWILIWRTHSGVGMDPYFLALVTIGLAMLQAGLVIQRSHATRPLLLGNGAALFNALVLDAFYARAIL